MNETSTISPDTGNIERWLPEMVQRIAHSARPAAIWLFGSRARGDHKPESDFDLLIILPRLNGTRREHAVALRRLLADIPAPKDLLVVSADEFAAKRDIWGTIPYEAARHGKRLYAA